MILNAEKAVLPPSGLRKAAILLLVLGEDASAPVLRELEEDEVQRVSREIARLSTISPELAESTLSEFHQMSLAHEFVVKGGVDYARRLLVNAYGPESAKRLLDRLMKALGTDMVTFDALQKAAYITRTWGDCYGYLLVATGRAELMVDPILNVWDAAAVQPIIEEAGGTFTDWQGAQTIHAGEAIATNGRVLKEVLAITSVSTRRA